MPKLLTHAVYGVMLTLEVVYILKKALILIFTFALAVCSHLRPSCDFVVDGRLVRAGCTPAAEKAALEAALMAAEEILPGKALAPEYSRRLHFGFSPAADRAPCLSDALLCAQPGLVSGSLVYVEGTRLGAVSDPESFRNTFTKYIENTLPTWAKSGSVRNLVLIPRYTRAGFVLPDEDMIMLVTGLSPVMYTDGNGRVSPV